MMLYPRKCSQKKVERKGTDLVRKTGAKQVTRGGVQSPQKDKTEVLEGETNATAMTQIEETDKEESTTEIVSDMEERGAET